MHTKNISFACLIVAVIVLTYFISGKNDINMYSIISQEQFDYSGNPKDSHLLLLDTKTGTIWTYYSKTGYESKKWHKNEFGN